MPLQGVITMIPFGNETVTLVQRTESTASGKTVVTYSTATLTGCSWKRSHGMRREADILVPYEGITCRVPSGQTKPKANDFMILGSVAVTVNSGADYQKLIDQYKGTDGAFMVASVADNARPGMPMPHYAARS